MIHSFIATYPDGKKTIFIPQKPLTRPQYFALKFQFSNENILTKIYNQSISNNPTIQAIELKN
jgi:hypothetical protein